MLIIQYSYIYWVLIEYVYNVWSTMQCIYCKYGMSPTLRNFSHQRLPEDLKKSAPAKAIMVPQRIQ